MMWRLAPWIRGVAWAALTIATTPGLGCAAPAPSPPRNSPPHAAPPPAPTEVCDLPAPPDGSTFVVESVAKHPLPTLPTRVSVPRGRVANVDIAMRGRMSPDIVRGLLATRAGAELDGTTLSADVHRIYALGNFEDVAVEAEPGPAGVRVRFVVTERPLIRALRFRGVDAPDRGRLAGVAQVAQGDLFDARALHEATRALRAHYLEQGYYVVEATARALRIDDRSVDVCLVVDTGPKVTVAALQLDGNRAVTEPELFKAMEVVEGGPNAPGGTHHQEHLERQVLLLTAAYYDRGFVQVKVGEPQIMLSDNRASMTIRIPIEEGPVFHLGKISAAGDLIADRRVYMDLIHTKPGATFGRQTMMEDLERIRVYHRTRGRDDLEVEPETTLDPDKHTVDIVIRVTKSGAAGTR